MRILYIGRRDGIGLKSWLRHQKRQLSFGEQDGFFEASLYSSAEVVEVTIDGWRHRDNLVDGFDAVVVNLKCGGFVSEIERDKFLIDTFSKINSKKAVFIGSAKAEQMITNSLANSVDVIFKREPYKNKGHYNLLEENQTKIVSTMISCPFVSLPRSSWLSKIYTSLKPEIKTCLLSESEKDIGFSGAIASAHSIREDVWQVLVEAGFSTIGGLQPNPYIKKDIAGSLKTPRFRGRTYRDSLCQAKINLALPGIGEYTFRHQELLYLGCFMLSHSSIDELELPLPLEEGKHYVSFSSLNEAVEKINFYLANENERQSIAAAGKKLFDEYYNPKIHGKQLIDTLN